MDFFWTGLSARRLRRIPQEILPSMNRSRMVGQSITLAPRTLEGTALTPANSFGDLPLDQGPCPMEDRHRPYFDSKSECSFGHGARIQRPRWPGQRAFRVVQGRYEKQGP